MHVASSSMDNYHKTMPILQKLKMIQEGIVRKLLLWQQDNRGYMSKKTSEIEALPMMGSQELAVF